MAGPRLIVLAALVSVVACSESIDWASFPVEERVFEDSADFLDGYWRRPVPLQGPAPEYDSPLEASLQPSACGTCHAPQYEDWQTTIHGSAYSPGLAGQLADWEGYNYQNVRDCLVCHAPLSEQAAQVPDDAGQLVSNPVFDREIQRQGLVCAACHVRGWRRYGPPRRDGSLAASPEGSPHDGVKRTPYFEDSRFCAGCHQFEAPAPNGKPLQNTYREWERSRYAEAGVGCQSCHMPDRRHLWRGVHDPEMVRGGVTVEWTEPPLSARAGESIALRITNSGTGHRFPTYVTPEVSVRIELLDADAEAIKGAVAETFIRRRVEYRGGEGWVELTDSRLAPDSSLTLLVQVVGSGARYARGTVRVYPDAFYQGQFASMLTSALSDTSRRLIGEAHRRASESSFTIFDDTIQVR